MTMHPNALKSPRERAEFIGEQLYAWPGGYALFAVTDDGGVLCKDCCIRERDSISGSIPGDGWYVVAVDHAGNVDERVDCDNCGRTIFDPDE